MTSDEINEEVRRAAREFLAVYSGETHGKCDPSRCCARRLMDALALEPAPPPRCFRCGDATHPGQLMLAGKGGALIPCPYCHPGKAVEWMAEAAVPGEGAYTFEANRGWDTEDEPAPEAAPQGEPAPPREPVAVCLLCLGTEACHGNPPHHFMSNLTSAPPAELTKGDEPGWRWLEIGERCGVGDVMHDKRTDPVAIEQGLGWVMTKECHPVRTRLTKAEVQERSPHLAWAQYDSQRAAWDWEESHMCRGKYHSEVPPPTPSCERPAPPPAPRCACGSQDMTGKVLTCVGGEGFHSREKCDPPPAPSEECGAWSAGASIRGGEAVHALPLGSHTPGTKAVCGVLADPVGVLFDEASSYACRNCLKGTGRATKGEG